MDEKSAFFNAFKKTLVLWVLLLFLALWSGVGILILVSIAFTGALPFLLGTLWLSLSGPGKAIRGQFEVWHVRVFAAAIFFAYWTYGQKWAADTINNLFGVDAKYFGITSVVLTALFTPFGVLYREDFVGVVYTICLGFFILLGGYYFVYLLLAERVVGRGKKIVRFFIMMVFVTFFLPLVVKISAAFKPAVMNFALWADFYENHHCTDPWVNQANGVVFLDGGRILGYFPRAADAPFKIVSCNYERGF